MYTVLFLCVLAVANAAPHYGYYHHGDFHDSGSSEEYHRPTGLRRSPRYPGFGNSLFDTKTFWEQLENEMKQMDEILKEFYQRFPSSVSSEGIEGNQYKIVIPLSGYKEDDITVKAREGVLMIQAVQKTPEGNQRSYLDIRTLPQCIELSGTWSYSKDVLTIQFPVKRDADATDNPVTELTDTELATTEPNRSREEMGHDDSDKNIDADVGNRGDNDQDKEVETNEIPDKNTIEATTYAVDLKNEVEFVPVSY